MHHTARLVAVAAMLSALSVSCLTGPVDVIVQYEHETPTERVDAIHEGIDAYDERQVSATPLAYRITVERPFEEAQEYLDRFPEVVAAWEDGAIEPVGAWRPPTRSH